MLLRFFDFGQFIDADKIGFAHAGRRIGQFEEDRVSAFAATGKFLIPDDDNLVLETMAVVRDVINAGFRHQIAGLVFPHYERLRH